jgi:hypothetical protein
MWPYRTYWNWGAGSGDQDGVLIGVNMGAKWTTGTGSNENGICIDGKLFKIMEDLVWTYDLARPMAPWRVRTAFSDAMDLTLKPFYERKISLDFGLIGSRGSCVFGLWEGTLNIEDRTVGVRALPGWAEDFSHKW